MSFLPPVLKVPPPHPEIAAVLARARDYAEWVKLWLLGERKEASPGLLAAHDARLVVELQRAERLFHAGMVDVARRWR